MNEPILVEILTFEGCPNGELAREAVRAVLEGAQRSAHVWMVDVRDATDAIALRFLGSPTIRVDGRDVEVDARSRTDYGFMCRTYRTPDGVRGVPGQSTIADAIREGETARNRRSS